MAAHAILFEHQNFRGRHRHLFQSEANLNSGNPGGSDLPGDISLNDKTSSICIIEGHWEFFADPSFIAKLGRTLGPGLYQHVRSPSVLGAGSEDRISSARVVSDP